MLQFYCEGVSLCALSSLTLQHQQRFPLRCHPSVTLCCCSEHSSLMTHSCFLSVVCAAPGFLTPLGNPHLVSPSRWESPVLFFVLFFYPSPDLSLINTFRKKETQIYTKIEKHKAVRTNFSFTNSKFKPHHPCTAGTAKPGLSHKTLPPSGEILNIDSSIFFHGSEI